MGDPEIRGPARDVRSGMLLLLLSQARAAREDCDNLAAARIAASGDAAEHLDCSVTPLTAPVAGYADCLGKTANTCAADRFDDPVGSGLLVPAPGTLEARFAPRCRDGSDVCGPEDEVRCVDGSRPVYWIEETGSDDWVYFFRGGESCRNRIEAGYTASVADDCRDDYFGLGPDPDLWRLMTGAQQPDHVEGGGILSPTERFGGYNRVFVHKCTFDLYQGDLTLPDEVASTGETFDLHFHGRRLIEAVVADTGVGPGDRLIVSGSSGGGFSVIENADWISDLTGADVRAVVASFFRPAASLEADCGVTSCVGGDAYSGGFTGTSAWSTIGTFDDTQFRGPQGRSEEWLSSWSDTPSDASCVAMHAGEEWKCWSPMHVVLEHVTTPVFVYQSTRDSVFTSPTGTDSYVDFDQNPGPSFVRWTPLVYQARVEAQAWSMGWHGVALGRREEPFDTANTPNPFGYFLRRSSVHETVQKVDAWRTVACLEHGATQVDLLDALERWVAGDATRLREGAWWTGASTCAP